MEENVKIAPSDFRGSPDADALYCEECLRVDRSFNDIPNEAARQDNPNHLGLSLKDSVDEIKPDTTCPSCRDILNILDELDPDMQYIKLVMEGDKFVGPTMSRFWSARVDTSTETFSEPYHNGYLLRRSDYHTRLRNDSVTHTEGKSLPMVLIKSWLHTCEREHYFCRSSPANELNMPLYLIDVVEECITLKPVSNVRYIALSYVWGNVKSTNLTSGNMEELRKPRSLSSGSHVATVPQTIRDAMRLTADLDIRYLWVDCLCLIQSDPNLSFYLDRMHLIYANAFLTIVVANKNNANGGITGYDTRLTDRILPGKVINYPNYVFGMGEKTRQAATSAVPWCSRAWTLQEGFSSRRVLVVDDRICLKCARDSFEEGSTFGFEGNHNLSDSMQVLLPTLCQAARSYDWQPYSQAAASFAPRALSYDGDSIKAFLGIVNFFTSMDDNPDVPVASNTKLLYGHPVCNLSRALLWSSKTVILERRMLLRPDGSFVMPSWSWMAWRHNCQTVSAPFRYQWPHGTPGARELQVPTVIYAQCGICLQNHQMTSEKCSNKASPERVKPEYLDPYLHIKAQRARFGVVRYAKEHHEVVKPWIPSGTTNEASRFLIPLDNTNNAERTIMGNVTLDHWPAQSPRGEADALDFIGIVYLEDNYFRGSGPSKVDALCVIPVNGKPGVFERRGVATISKEAWDQTAQFDENIILG